MRPGTVLGALLVFAGVVALSVAGFSFTRGPVPLPTALGGLALAAGIIFIVANARKAR
jgi:uncharacterized membrane protein HdeD (DUF308 family)